MAIAVTVNEVASSDGGVTVVYGTIVPSGTYPGSGGETFDCSFPGSKVQIMPGKGLPIWVSIVGQAGFVYQYTYGTTIANGKFTVYTNTAGGANNALGEHTNASYVAGVSGDTIKFAVAFRNFGNLS